VRETVDVRIRARLRLLRFRGEQRFDQLHHTVVSRFVGRVGEVDGADDLACLSLTVGFGRVGFGERPEVCHKKMLKVLYLFSQPFV